MSIFYSMSHYLSNQKIIVMAFFMKLLIFIVLPFMLIFFAVSMFLRYKQRENDRQRQHEMDLEKEKTRQSENISKHLE